KYLGIMIDSHLNWKCHITELCKKLKRNLGALSKIRYFVNINILKQLYYSLVFPHITYGILVWGNTYSTTLKPLFLMQKRAIR
ncbi:predicted protein, partial [Nematostella vectensis]